MKKLHFHFNGIFSASKNFIRKQVFLSPGIILALGRKTQTDKKNSWVSKVIMCGHHHHQLQLHWGLWKEHSCAELECSSCVHKLYFHRLLCSTWLQWLDIITMRLSTKTTSLSGWAYIFLEHVKRWHELKWWKYIKPSEKSFHRFLLQKYSIKNAYIHLPYFHRSS